VRADINQPGKGILGTLAIILQLEVCPNDIAPVKTRRLWLSRFGHIQVREALKWLQRYGGK
jgi:hypothetical protein